MTPTLNMNTVRTHPATSRNTHHYEVLDSLGRSQATFGELDEACEYAGRICRFGWLLEYGDHAGTGECAPDHVQHEALAVLSALAEVAV